MVWLPRQRQHAHGHVSMPYGTLARHKACPGQRCIGACRTLAPSLSGYVRPGVRIIHPRPLAMPGVGDGASLLASPVTTTVITTTITVITITSKVEVVDVGLVEVVGDWNGRSNSDGGRG